MFLFSLWHFLHEQAFYLKKKIKIHVHLFIDYNINNDEGIWSKF